MVMMMKEQGVWVEGAGTANPSKLSSSSSKAITSAPPPPPSSIEAETEEDEETRAPAPTPTPTLARGSDFNACAAEEEEEAAGEEGAELRGRITVFPALLAPATDDQKKSVRAPLLDEDEGDEERDEEAGEGILPSATASSASTSTSIFPSPSEL